MSTRRFGRRRWPLALGAGLAIGAFSGAATGSDGGDDASVVDADASTGGSAGAAGQSGASGEAGGGAAGTETTTHQGDYDQGFECGVHARAPRALPLPVALGALGLALGLAGWRRLRVTDAPTPRRR